ncbi:hypothetical protein ACQJ2V_27980, partial [Klebsiella variicola subsp. variicola]|uniref:hypothetical protein n=1 Tax=Klebsiella variicola TaxID=244366 RepID=UPI003CFBE60C
MSKIRQQHEERRKPFTILDICDSKLLTDVLLPWLTTDKHLFQKAILAVFAQRAQKVNLAQIDLFELL